MEGVKLLLIGLPLFLFCTDLLNLFSTTPPPPPPTPSNPSHHQQPFHHQPPSPQQQEQETLDSSTTQGRSSGGGIGSGTTIDIKFCSSCSYKGTAVKMKALLETSFPGISVILSNHPPTLPKRMLSKVVPAVQIGVIGIAVAGEHIFPRLGFMVPPPWYFSLRQNKFGTIATSWVLGNVVQSFLQSSGAFEVFYNGELVFSKLEEHRFPSELELRQAVSKKLTVSRIIHDHADENLWS